MKYFDVQVPGLSHTTEVSAPEGSTCMVLWRYKAAGLRKVWSETIADWTRRAGGDAKAAREQFGQMAMMEANLARLDRDGGARWEIGPAFPSKASALAYAEALTASDRDALVVPLRA